MGNFSNARVHYGLQITGTPTKTNVLNDVFVGVSPQTVPISGIVSGYSTSGIIGASGGTIAVDLLQNQFNTGTPPVAQVETATAAGTISAAGNATVIVTGARIAGSPVTLSVPVLSGDTASAWAAKVRAALTANSAISSVYAIGGSTTAITLTEKIAVYANDATLNVSLDNGTCAGITTATTSADTTAGVAGAIVTSGTGDGKDFEGVAIATVFTNCTLLVECLNGSFDFSFNDTSDFLSVSSGQKRMFIGGVNPDQSGAAITSTSADARFTITAVLFA